MEFYELRNQAGLLNSDAATLFKTSRATIRRWDKHNSPEHVIDKLKLMTGFDPHWKNIKIQQGRIITDTGYQLTANDLRLVEYRENLLNHVLGISEAQSRQLRNVVFRSNSANERIITNIYQDAVNSL